MVRVAVLARTESMGKAERGAVLQVRYAVELIVTGYVDRSGVDYATIAACEMPAPVMDGPDPKELPQLLQSLESDRVERKRSAADGEKIRQNICAFANDLPGYGSPGIIFIGVEDDGACAHLEIGDELLKTLAAMRDDGNIMPMPSIIVQRHRLSGCHVAVVAVEPDRNPPVRYRGVVWVGVGPTVRPGYA